MGRAWTGGAAAGSPVAAGAPNAWRGLVALNGGGDAAIDGISATGPAVNWFLL